QHNKVRGLACFYTVAAVIFIDSHDTGTVDRNQVESFIDLINMSVVGEVGTVVQNGHHIPMAERVPVIRDGILGKRESIAAFEQLLHTSQSAAFRIVVPASLQVGVLSRA